MTWRELTAEQLYSTLKDPLLVDVRSPCESAAESIPGAINVPLLNDDERAQVGTTYVQVGEMVARRMALTLISPKIPSIVDRILTARRSGQAVVVHCWRGGLRSEAVASFLAIIGIDCWRLTGGYKSWRRYVLDQLSEVNYSFTPVVLQGLTGVGKTEILNELAKLNVPTIDLEDIANHRGSAFGGIGLNGQPTQKNFEAALWMKLRHTSSGPLVLEAESRKIGKLALPDLLVNNIAKGRQILVVGSLDTRASRIACEYSTKYADSPEVLQEALDHLGNLKASIGKNRIDELKSLVATGALEEAVKRLLILYYDPLYQSKIDHRDHFDLTVNGDDPHSAAQAINEWLKDHFVATTGRKLGLT